MTVERHEAAQPATWRAAVVLVRRRDGRVLAVTRGSDMQNWNLPGGNRELRDGSPAATARRELQEETGLWAKRLRPLASWDAEQGGRVVAFEAEGVEGQLRPSPEGRPGWVDPRLLKSRRSTYHRHNALLLGTPTRRSNGRKRRV